MKNYLVTVTAHCPCPRFRDYRIVASGFHTAISRSIKLFRKDIGRKKISQFNVEAKQL